MSEPRTLTITSEADARQAAPDVVIMGNTDHWQLLSKASCASQGWMHSTKAMKVGSLGCLVQVSTLQNGLPAEALAFVPGAWIEPDENGGRKLVWLRSEDDD